MKYEDRSPLDKKFKAIAGNTRYEIIKLLAERPLSASEIASHFTFSFASISHHLQKLEESGLVASKRAGKYKNYSLCVEAFEEMYSWLVNLISP